MKNRMTNGIGHYCVLGGGWCLGDPDLEIVTVRQIVFLQYEEESRNLCFVFAWSVVVKYIYILK